MRAQPAVVVVSGHMLDAPDRPSPRFPPDQVPRVTAEATAALDRWGVGPATTLITGGARGADLIVAELALERGAKVELVLALPPEEFERRSVALPDSDWVDRFRRIRAAASAVDIVAGPHDDGAFARANARIVAAARALDARPHAVIVWNGREGDGPGGTRDFVRRLGHGGPDERVEVIDPTRRAYEERQAPGAPKKLLALDGGGIRGVLGLEILAALERRLGERYGRDDYVLADYFDYVGGTSTGAIIAAGLALGRPVADVRAEYEALAPKVFRRRFLPLQLRSRYRDRELSTELVRYFGAGRTLGDPELRTLLLVVLHNSVTDSVWPLSNNTRARYNRAERYLNQPPDRNLDLPLTKLVRGSTAAPVYFPPEEIQVGAATFVFEDGGVTPFNNPAMLMFVMATLPEYGLGWPSGADAMLVVSAGTGAAAAVHRGAAGAQVNVAFQAKSLPGVFMSGASVGQDLTARAFGRTRAGAVIDREVGDRIGAAAATGAYGFTYVRYDADLSSDALASAGIADPQRQKHLRKLDAVDCVPELQELGRRVGATIDLDGHLAGFL